MFNRRLSILQSTEGKTHQNLPQCVEEKLGHLEKAEYFCYKCRQLMKETSAEIFECVDCKVKYDTREYRIKRI
jgi:hypothetical protein